MMAKDQCARQITRPTSIGNAEEAAKKVLQEALGQATAVAEAACAAYPDMEQIQAVCGDLLLTQLELATAAVSRLR